MDLNNSNNYTKKMTINFNLFRTIRFYSNQPKTLFIADQLENDSRRQIQVFKNKIRDTSTLPSDNTVHQMNMEGVIVKTVPFIPIDHILEEPFRTSNIIVNTSQVLNTVLSKKNNIITKEKLYSFYQREMHSLLEEIKCFCRVYRHYYAISSTLNSLKSFGTLETFTKVKEKLSLISHGEIVNLEKTHFQYCLMIKQRGHFLIQLPHNPVIFRESEDKIFDYYFSQKPDALERLYIIENLLKNIKHIIISRRTNLCYTEYHNSFNKCNDSDLLSCRWYKILCNPDNNKVNREKVKIPKKGRVQNIILPPSKLVQTTINNNSIQDVKSGLNTTISTETLVCNDLTKDVNIDNIIYDAPSETFIEDFTNDKLEENLPQTLKLSETVVPLTPNDTKDVSNISILIKQTNNLKIVSYNINSIRKHLESLKNLIQNTNADVILLQETRCSPENFPESEIIQASYNIALSACTEGKRGVAILSKYPITFVTTTLPGESDVNHFERYLEVTIIVNNKSITLASVYVPYSRIYHFKSPKKERPALRNKINFLSRLRKRIKELKPKENMVIIGGDFNVHLRKNFDELKNPRIEQVIFNRILDLGLVNAPMHKRNIVKGTSLQLDHILVSIKKANKLLKVTKHTPKMEDDTITTETINDNIKKKAAHVPLICNINMDLKHSTFSTEPKSLFIVGEREGTITRKRITI